MLDFNNAPPQREMGDLIPDGTVATVHMTVRQGNVGEGGWLRRSKAGDSMQLDCEFTVVDGPFAKRKFWTLFTVDGATDGQQKAGEISGSRLRGILESARGIMPDDRSEAAQAARKVDGYADFDGLRFVAKIGIEKAKEGSGFKDKNVLDIAITPERKGWTRPEQIAKASPIPSQPAQIAAVAKAPGVKKPSWAS